MNVVDITSAQRIDYGLMLKEEEDEKNEKKKSRGESLEDVGTLKTAKTRRPAGRVLRVHCACLGGSSRVRPYEAKTGAIAG